MRRMDKVDERRAGGHSDQHRTEAGMKIASGSLMVSVYVSRKDVDTDRAHAAGLTLGRQCRKLKVNLTLTQTEDLQRQRGAGRIISQSRRPGTTVRLNTKVNGW